MAQQEERDRNLDVAERECAAVEEVELSSPATGGIVCPLRAIG